MTLFGIGCFAAVFGPANRQGSAPSGWTLRAAEYRRTQDPRGRRRQRGLMLPNTGAPKTRIGGGARGADAAEHRRPPDSRGRRSPRWSDAAEGWCPKSRVGEESAGLQLPNVGAPKNRVGGGVRGGEGEDANHLMSMPVVHVLTPESIGYTVSESPMLYYYVTDDTTLEFEVTVNRDERTLIPCRSEKSRSASTPSR